jgi:hypothetical protein
MPPTPEPPPEPGALLEKVADFYHKALLRGRRGLRRLSELGLEDRHLIAGFRLGHCDGRLLKVMPSADPRREALAALGLIDARGERPSERLLDHLVVPLADEDDGVLALWGVSLRGDRQTTVVPPDASALWNLKAAKLYPEVILCAGLLDALSLTRAGFPNVVGLATGRLSEEDAARLKALGVRRVAVLAESEVIRRLRPRLARLELSAVMLGAGDSLNARLLRDGDARLVEFVDARLKAAPVEQPTEPGEAGRTSRLADGLALAFGNRAYALRGIERTVRRLRATVRAEFRGRLHVDTLDLYNARARKLLAQDLCRLFEESADIIEADVGRIVAACEQYRPGEPGESAPAVVLSIEERADAEAFGRSEDLLERIAADYEACGLVGERANKLVSYLAAVSRKLDDPLSVLVLSSSGAGKSALQDATLAFAPPEDVVKVTALTGRALFYKGRTSLKHRILAVEEGAGARDAVYAIRNLVSAKVLVVEAAVKDFATGRIVTVENRVEGPTAVFITTTDPDIDPETRSRFVVLTVDESREQTRAILDVQRKSPTLQAMAARDSVEAVLRRHRNFQRLLKPMLVVIPQAQGLQYGDDRLQSRRDHPKYLNLIRAVTFLRQMGREARAVAGGDGAPYVEATDDDIQVAGRLLAEACGRNPDDLNGVSRALLAQIERMVAMRAGEQPGDAGEVEFTRRDIREYTGWAHARVQRYLGQLVDFEYVVAMRGRNGVRYVYRLAAPPVDGARP